MTTDYQALAVVYDRLMATNRRLLLRRLDAVLARYAPDARSLYDIGAGTGVVAAHYTARGLQVTAVEPAAAMRALARQRLDRLGASAEVVAGTFEDFALPHPGRVDVVLATGEVVNHLSDTSALERSLARTARALAPGGLAWLDASTGAWFETLWSRGPRERTAAGARTRWSPTYDRSRRRGVMEVTVWPTGSAAPAVDRIAMRPFDYDEVTAAVRRAGLELIEATPLTGVRLGRRTGRIGYGIRRPPGELARRPQRRQPDAADRAPFVS